MSFVIFFTIGYLSGGFTALVLIGLTLIAQRSNAAEERLAEKASKQVQP